MGNEIDLMSKYPKTKRDVLDRGIKKTEQDIAIARKFDKEFFDGDRKFGYGGYTYDPRFWNSVIPDFISYYHLDENSSILDVGCGKGFMLYEFSKFLPNANIRGIDISSYAIENCKSEVRDFLQVANATNLPFNDNSFDLVISIVSIHNLDHSGCAKALKEINRVTKKNAFITVDAYSNEQEKQLMDEWNLTALTVMSCSEWIKFFRENEYEGDYYWFKP